MSGMSCRIPAIPALLAVLALASGTLAAEQPKETWVNYYDAAKGLWAKKDLVSGEVRYLARYGESRDQVSFLKEEDLRGIEARNTIRRIVDSELEAHSRGIGDSLFRPAATVGEVARFLEDSGWSVKSYETEDRIYGKKGAKTSIKLPRGFGAEMRGKELFSLLTAAGVEPPKDPEPSRPVAKNRNK